MKLLESKTDKLFLVITSIFIVCFGIVSIFLKGYFLGFLSLGIGSVGLFFSIKKLRSKSVIIEFKDDGIILPYKGKERLFNYNEIAKGESVTSLLGNDSPGNVIKLYLKGIDKPLKISFPVINVDENEVIRMINQRIR